MLTIEQYHGFHEAASENLRNFLHAHQFIGQPFRDLASMDSAFSNLLAELNRIKDGIKRCQITMIVDGGDMCDHGWVTQEDCNSRVRKAKTDAAVAIATAEYNEGKTK